MTSSEQKLEDDEDAGEAWSVEIRRRVREIEEGKTKLIPWCEARRLIAGG